MPTYNKPFLSLPDQLALIKSRGMIVPDDAAAIDALHRNGYYRLSAYWFPFRQIVAGQRGDAFLTNSNFDDVTNLYRFDKELKLLLLDAIERVEIAVRVDIAIQLGQRDPFAHEHASSFHTRFTTPSNPGGSSGFDRWLDRYAKRVVDSNEEFVIHHESTYGSRRPLPIWIAIELWDFGLLSYAYSGMKNADQVAVAARYGIADWRILESWLRSLNSIRNVIAHHGRMWNTNVTQIPRLPGLTAIPAFDPIVGSRVAQTRIYCTCCILSYLTSVINPQSSWIADLKNHVAAFPNMPHAKIQDMGFPSNWQTHDFWK